MQNEMKLCIELQKLGWTVSFMSKTRLRLTKNGIKLSGHVDLYIDKKEIIVYNINTTYAYQRSELRPLTFEEINILSRYINDSQ